MVITIVMIMTIILDGDNNGNDPNQFFSPLQLSGMTMSGSKYSSDMDIASKGQNTEFELNAIY